MGAGQKVIGALLGHSDSATTERHHRPECDHGPGRATLLPSGKVLVAGGGASAELYDPVAGTLTATGKMTVARYGQTATLLPSGKVFIAGGGPEVQLYSIFASAELYDPGAGTFTLAGSMSVAREDHTATLLPNGKVLITGGDYNSGGFMMVLASAELYQ
jgi:hypothetical protein